MTLGPFHHRLANERKTWLARFTFIGAVSALAFATTIHTHPGEASAQSRSSESRAEEDDYTLTLSSVGTFTNGKEGFVTVKLVPKGTFKVDRNFNSRFVLADPPGANVALTKKKLEKADATITDTSLTFVVPFTPQKDSRATITGKLHFKVCETKCNTHNVDMSLTVEVNPAAAKP